MRVPDDVALVCFDDPVDGDLLDPPMTALARHYGDLGEVAAASSWAPCAAVTTVTRWRSGCRSSSSYARSCGC